MDDHRILKRVFYSQLAHGSRTLGGQMKHYKDTLQVNMKACDIPTADLESLALDRDSWHTTCHEAIARFVSNRFGLLKREVAATQDESFSYTTY
jgi:hypothetical protein